MWSARFKNPVLYPASKIGVTIEGRLITRNLYKEIIQAYTSRDIRTFMEGKFKWDTKTADCIDWESHGSNLSKLDYYQNKFVVKLIHERLPCRAASFNPSNQKECPCCNKTKETIEHMQECEENQEKWEQVIELIVPIYNKYKIDPILRILLNAFIKNPKRELRQVINENKINNYKPYMKLINEQRRIGWKQLRYGRWSRKWAEYQYRYQYIMRKEGETRTEPDEYPKWIGAVIQELWKHQRRRWNNRNQQAYNTEKPNPTRINCLKKIKALYSKRNKLQHQDQFIFEILIEQWETQSVTQMKGWIKRNKPYIKHCVKMEYELVKLNASDITKYFQRGRTKTQIDNKIINERNKK